MKFEKYDVVRHVKTDGYYLILETPEEGLRLEHDNSTAYRYQPLTSVESPPPRYVRAAEKMEDGRFALFFRPTQDDLAPTNRTAFVEELIQLQIKHGIVLQGYDVTLWTREDGVDAAARHNNPDYLVTEEKIRDRWEDLKDADV